MRTRMVRKLLVAAIALLLVGCAQDAESLAKARYIATSNSPVEFLFPPGWHKSTKDNPFDLQCFAKHERANTGVFVYAREDLAEDFEPRELFQFQIEDLQSKRRNVRIKDAEEVVCEDGKKLTSVVFSGEKGSSRYFYRFTLVEFDGNPDFVAVVLQVAIPSEWTTYKPILEGIVRSARIRTGNAEGEN
jgi:hypothetical protein